MNKLPKENEKKNDPEAAIFFCFKIGDKIKNGIFSIKDSKDLEYQIINVNQLTILKVFLRKNYSNWNVFKKSISFKIIYKLDKLDESKVIFSSQEEFKIKIKKKKYKFFYNAAKNGMIYNQLFQNPNCNSQFNAFMNLNNNNANFRKNLISNTLKFFKKYFDLSLYLKLLEEKNILDDLKKIIDNFSNLKVERNDSLLIIAFDANLLNNFPNTYKDKIIIIYSVITDAIDLLDEMLDKNLINIIYDYNKNQKDYPLLFKKNVLTYFIKKLTSLEDIKKLCQNCYSIPILFECLSNNENDKIKGLSYSDLPKNLSPQDNFLELVENYERIKYYFRGNEIISLWRQYLEMKYKKNDIEDLNKYKEKLISIDREFYSSIIKEISDEINNMRKKFVINRNLKGKELINYIIKYNKICNFYSDEQLLLIIAENIDLKELKEDEESLNNFNDCKFFTKIDENKISYFFYGFTKNIKTFEDLYLFFRFVYPLRPKIQDFDRKDNIVSHLIITHFFILLNQKSNYKIKLVEHYNEIIQTIILLSIMHIKNNEQNYYIYLIQKLGSSSAFDREDLINFFIQWIINYDISKYISLEKKKEISNFILQEFFFKLNIDKQISFLSEFQSLEFKEENIYIKFPKITFKDLLDIEDKESIIYLQNFIKTDIINKDVNSLYFKELISICNSFFEKLEKKQINFHDAQLIYELLVCKKLSSRINCICLGDQSKSSNLLNDIEKYAENYIRYYKSLEILIKFYKKYYKNTKKNEIDKYSLQLQYFKQSSKYIDEIIIKENIYDEIKKFEKYEKSNFFNIFYNELENEINETNKFNKAVEALDKCKNLFNKEKLEISFFEKILNKLDNYNNILNEIKYLKDYFENNEGDAKIITEQLLFYKNRQKILDGLKELINIAKIFLIPNINNIIDDINKIIEEIKNIHYFYEISDIIRRLKNLDDNILEKDFIEILCIFNRNNQDLFEFLNSKNESETRDLIDGLFEDENDDISIELRDIEILINCVCFIKDIKSEKNTKDIKVFLFNFHNLLNKNNKLYREIISNLIHIENKKFEFEQYIKIQLGKNIRNSNNIDKFLQTGVIKFEKKTQEENCLSKNDIKTIYVANIIMGQKEQSFEDFKRSIKKMMTKSIYSYGEKSNNFQKVKKIIEIIFEILKELNLNINIQFNKTYNVPLLKFEDKTVLIIPEMEKDLKELKNQNAQIKNKNFEALYNNPSLQFLSNFDLYDFDLTDKKKNIENYFPNINELNKMNTNMIIHYNIICKSCKMYPIIGIRYKCKTCYNFNYCEKCMEKNMKIHSHEFMKIENAIEKNEIYNEIPPYLLVFLLITKIDNQYNDLKGLFFYKTSKNDYEIDILKIFNKLLNKFENNSNLIYPISFYKKLPFRSNLLLCNDDCTESEIYSFCAKAINCTLNCLFIIVRPEEMNIGTEKFFFKTFNRLLEKKNYNINSCIIVLYINQSSHIIKQLKKIKEKYGFPEEPAFFKLIEKTEIDNLTDIPIEIVTSDSPRVGKTTYIAQKIDKISKIYRSFCLGDIDKNYLSYISSNLSRIEKRHKSIIFQLYQNSDENTYWLIRNFLFKFLILKYYDKYDYISDKNINIYIEVSSDYTHFNEDFKILELFKRKNIELKNHPNFYEENQILTFGNNYSKIRRILSYLNLLKNNEINTKNMKIFQEIKTFFLKDSEFGQIIKYFFIKKFSSKNILPNYGQIQMFINLIDDLISHFEKCKDMSPLILKKEIQKNDNLLCLNNIRQKIIEYYVDLVVKFSCISYESILENQEVAAKNQKNLEYKLSNEYKKKLIDQLNQKRIISYNEIEPSVVLFNNPEDDDVDLNICSIITISDEKKEEFNQLKVLYVDYLKQDAYLSTINDDQEKPFFIRQLNSICLTSKSKREEIINEKKLENYEFTSDNFIKMVLIFLRIRANIPLILLGETGCGKTSLIKALSYFLEDNYKLINFNIHSGISYQDIMQFLYKNNLLKKRENENEIKLFGLIQEETKDDDFEVINEKKIILFLDEINTTNSINLIVEIFTSHSFLGNSLRDNVYVIGACNPYRLMLSHNEEIGYINKKRHRIRNLIYTVNPLPLSLINYIFDFGNLREEEEKKYINSFIRSFLDYSFSQHKGHRVEEETKIYDKVYKVICDSVYECQTFIRNNSEISSVSLREIQRFKKFFEFFLDITSQRNEYKQNNPKEYVNNEIKLYLMATNLGLYICYYLRIIDHKKREELEKKLKEILGFDFLEYPHKLENEIADNMNLSKGIAKNRALLDNIFTLFVCLNVKIPIFICGKAGCSKTLSFSLLYQSMKGEYSDNILFKKYPKLYVSSYQGSLTSNSEEIKTIFKRARNLANPLKNKSRNFDNNENNTNNENKNNDDNNKTIKKNKVLSVILFDEMGLAEISPNNPLKVIHSELDNNNDEIGFVGISNWSLDASKMNRGVHLSIQEPDEKDLILTANTIGAGIYDEIKTIYQKVIEDLARSYYEYKQLLYKKYKLFYDFHGARDFYYLIKITARMLKANISNISQKSTENIAMESIERNFGGLELDKEDENNSKWSSTKKFKEIFSIYQQSNIESIDKYDIFSCIQKNLEEDNNRYLLLITDRTKNDTLIEFILKKLKLNYRFIQGSKLKEDQNENYVLKKAWNIIESMEKGEIIILKDMEIIYPKFYDLFNQNLQKYGNSLYARIVLDSTTNERHIVNDKFRCIILLEKSNVNEQDPPFLNRFEKHLISFQYILKQNENKIAKELFEEIKDLTSIPENKKSPPLLVNINIEEIRCLILDLSIKEKDIEKNLVQVYKLLIPTFSQENLLSAIFSQEKKFIKKDDILQIYEENSHTNIFNFFEKVQNNKLIIYTFSPYYKDIFNEKEEIKVENKKFGTICKENTLEFTFNEKLSENMLNYFFTLFYEKINCNLFVIHFKVKDSKFLKYIKFQLDNYHKKVEENKKKIFLFIIHIKKNNPIESLEKAHSFFFSFLSEYQQITIDNISECHNISVVNLYKKTNEELLVIKELFDVDSLIKREFSRKIIEIGINQNNTFIDKLDNLSGNGILNCIVKNIQNSIKNTDNILRKILIDYFYLKEKDYDFISYFVEKIEILISETVENLINELTKNGYLVSFMFQKEIPEKIKKTIITFINNINLLNYEKEDNLENYLIDLKIPGSKLLFQKIFTLIQNCKNDYMNKEEEYRKNPKKKVEKNNTKEKVITLEDIHFEKKQYLKSHLWNEELLSDDIFKDYYQELIQDFFYLLFYDKDKSLVITKKEKEFLLFLYSKRNITDTCQDRFYYFFLWAGCYQEIIFKFLEIISIVDKYFNNKNNKNDEQKLDFLDTLKEIYGLIKFPEENDSEKKNKKEKVNDIFYKVSEAICEIITNINNIDYSKIKDLELLCKDYNNISQILSQFNLTLNLGLKKQYSLFSIVKLIEYYIKLKNKLKKKDYQLNEFIKNIYDEVNYLLKNNISEAILCFKNQLNIAIKLSEKLAMKIFENKLLEYNKNEDYKLELINILFEYPNLIKYSSLFFNYIFLLQPIKPKKQTKEILSENDKNEYIKKFCEIKKNKNKDKILDKIDKEAENNEVLKEILIYIFELRIISYFDDCQKSRFIQKSPKLLLLGLNFDYYKICCININNKQYGNLKNIGMTFYFSFIRCYLHYFVKLQIENRDIGDLTKFHEDLLNISDSILGQLISLYIAKLFSFYKKQDYFFKEYLKEEKNDWKKSIVEQCDKEQLFSIKNYDNSNHLLFDLWNELNNKGHLNKDYLKKLNIKEICYLINFCYNEMSQKKDKDILVQSKLIEEISKIKDYLDFGEKINHKIIKLFEKLSNLEFYKDDKIISNLYIFFNMIKLYIIGFAGINNNTQKYLTTMIYSDSLIELIKIFYYDKLNEALELIENYYKMKEFLEEEYKIKKSNTIAYLCSCGKFYKSKREYCICGKYKMTLVFYDEEHKKKNEKKKKSQNKTLKEIKEEKITPLFVNLPKLQDLLFNNKEINNENFGAILINYIFVCQLFIEYKFGFIPNEIFDKDIFSKILDLHKLIDKYLEQKDININYFLNSFSDSLILFLEKNDYIKKKEIYYEFINEKISKIIDDNNIDNLKNIETNILTKYFIKEEKNKDGETNSFDQNLKYLLTITKYPNIEELTKAVLSYKKNPLPILKAFVTKKDNPSSGETDVEQNFNDDDINKLKFIEKINDFINAFSEENKNLISRQKIEEDTIEKYLEISRRGERGNSSLDIKFKSFCEAYDEITNVSPYHMTKDQPVKVILNDDINETSIYLLYKHLIELQNNFLKKVIQEYDKTKNDNKDIIIQNAIDQLKKEIPIQHATISDIFEFNVKNNIFLSFEELFSFYSIKNIFNKNNNKIDYANYSNIKFNLKNIEKELINIILTGKKLFSDKQITYKFYLDPYKVEEKTKKLEEFAENYGREELTDNEKELIFAGIENLKKIFLPNLEMLINYLIKQKNFQSNQALCDIKFNSNLYLNQNFIQFFSCFKFITLNKLISLYEYIEEKLWETIADRYVNKNFHCSGTIEKIKSIINKFIKSENTRELKNNMLISLLIKFICRYLPYAKEDLENKDLFKTIIEKNTYLSDNIKKELQELTKEWGIEVKNAIDLTKRIVSMTRNDNKKESPKLNESIISEGSQILTEEIDTNYEEEEQECNSEEERNY